MTSTFPVQAGHDVLVHAAAGGVGLLLTQLAAQRGARVIATVGSAEKERLAREAGAADVIRYRELDDLTRDLPAEVRSLTDGRGVHAVFDSVGKDTFDASLASPAPPRDARPVRRLVRSGPAGRPAAPQRGRLALPDPPHARPLHRHPRRARLARRASCSTPCAPATLDVRVGATFPLADAADAHRALESRSTTGKVLLLP